jgi:hypothetical protein
LIDPHLKEILPPLVNDFLLSLNFGPGDDAFRSKGFSAIPIYRAISKVLYNLCKIRGEKVISRFFSNEAKYLEPMLTAFERRDAVNRDTAVTINQLMIWEEKYVMLLWIGHLLLTPFNLDTVSSDDLPEDDIEQYLQGAYGFNVPHGLPPLVLRVLRIAMKYLTAPGRERGGAVLALVRLSTRPDMIKKGLLNSMLEWAIRDLKHKQDEVKSVYHYVGTLSYLSSVVQTLGNVTGQQYLRQILRAARAIGDNEEETYVTIRGSALSRKVLIKIFRQITLLTLPSAGGDKVALPLDPDILEDSIDRLLNYLGDNDTPIRIAASKALSMVTAKLEPSLAGQVIEAVTGSLEENVLWKSEGGNKQSGSKAGKTGTWKRDLSQVNPLKWHGLTMTLAQLLFRRSSPPNMLPEVINALLLALQFEQRSSTGSAVGVNVRDAACFGVWSLSRRYKTAELLPIEVGAIKAAEADTSGITVIQLLAIQLVISACLDPSGNIRRGSSAALQELVGRHPNMISEGIRLVQVVDYHTVALRSTALTQVATEAASLDPIYWRALFGNMLDWRGSDSNDLLSRRVAGTAFGQLVDTDVKGLSQLDRVVFSLGLVFDCLRLSKVRDVETRHGLFLAMTGILDSAAFIALSKSSDADAQSKILDPCWAMFEKVVEVPDEAFRSNTLRPELTCEAICKYLSSLVRRSQHADHHSEGYKSFIDKSIHILSLSLIRRDEIVIEVTTQLSEVLFELLSSEQKSKLIKDWLLVLEESIGSRARCTGHIGTLGSIFRYCSDDKLWPEPSVQQTAILKSMTTYVGSAGAMESRVACMKALGEGVLVYGGRYTQVITCFRLTQEISLHTRNCQCFRHCS